MDQSQEMTEAEFIINYNPSKWERPSVTVDALVYTVVDNQPDNYRKLPDKLLKVLLIRRGGHPCKGQWALPGGFVNMDENLEDAVARELKEETGIDDVYLEQLYTWGDVDRDKRTRIISVSYLALVDGTNLEVKADDDAVEAAWFEISYELIKEKKSLIQKGHIKEHTYALKLAFKDHQISAIVCFVMTVEGSITKTRIELLETDGIAFDHGKIIVYGIERLRSKIEYTDIVFNMMPQQFTLTQLQQVYEVILGKPLLKGNFRRKVAPMVCESQDYTTIGGHRPSKLYTYNPNWKQP